MTPLRADRGSHARLSLLRSVRLPPRGLNMPRIGNAANHVEIIIQFRLIRSLAVESAKANYAVVARTL